VAIVRLAVPSVGYTALTAARYFCVLIVAAAVPGGVVALTVAWAFYMLPAALTARPVAQASLPHLSRAFHRRDELGYSEGFDRNLGLALFFAVPAAILYALLSGPLATAVAFGEMATPEGREILRYSMLGISLGVMGQSAMEFATLAAYARRDAGGPLRAVALRAVLTAAGLLVTLAVVTGPVALLAIGLSIAVSDIVAGIFLCRRIRRCSLRPASSLARTAGTTMFAGLAMLPVVLVLLALVERPSAQLDGVLVILLVGVAGAVAYLGAQWTLRSPEMAGLLSLVPGHRKTQETGRD
jgi:putative peptidoglycan lipid II flippase